MAKSKFKARMYTAETSDAQVVEISVAHGCVCVSTAEDSYELSLSEFELELAGQMSDRVKLTHIPSTTILLVADKELLREIKEHGGDSPIVKKASRAYGALKHYWFGRLRYVGIICGVIAAGILAFYLSFDLLVERAVKEIPPSVEESFGDMAVDKEKLDQKSDDYKRVKRISDRLLKALGKTPYHFEFYVKNEKEVNACAVPGGRIVVLSRLLKEAKSDDEIAGVLAHEFGHVIHRDSLRRLLHTGGLGLCLAIITGGAVNNDSLAVLIPAAHRLESLNYSRTQEAAADNVAVDLTLKAGYKPEALIDFFERMEKRYPSGGPILNALVSDHPMGADRVAAIKAEAARVRAKMAAEDGPGPQADHSSGAAAESRTAP